MTQTKAPGNLRRFLSFLKPHIPLLSVLGLLVLAVRGVGLPLPLLYRGVVDEALAQKDTGLLFRYIAGLGGLLVLGRLFTFGLQVLSARAQQGVLHDVRLAVYEHLQRQGFEFYRKHATGGLLSRIISDVAQVQHILSRQTFEIAVSAIQVLVVGGILLWLNPRLSLISALVFPLLVGLVAIFQRPIYRISRAMQERREALSARLQENLSGIRLIQSLALEEEQLQRTSETSRELCSTVVRSELVGSSINMLTVALTDLPLTVFVWGYGGWLVTKGELSLGGLLAFHQYLMMLYGPVIAIFRFNIQLQVARAAVDRVYEVLDSPPSVEDRPDAAPLEVEAGAIHFEGVTLRYPGAPEPAVKELELKLAPGEVLGVVGPSGAGKTTLVNGLLRFLEPEAGRILVDGQDLRRVTAHSLRRQVGLVAQEVFLFSDSVAANIALARPDLGRPEVEDAARAAQAHAFIEELEQGYETVVGERGLGLSGGERQRVALARAFVQDPPVLVLDEATSALDARSEALVQEALAELVRGRTVLIIAHRFSTLKLCDRIAVLSGGRLVEEGSHEELSRSGGLYRALLQAQLLEAPGELDTLEPELLGAAGPELLTRGEEP